MKRYIKFVNRIVITASAVTILFFVKSISAYRFERNYIPKNKHEVLQLKQMLKLDEVKYLVIHETANESVGADAYAHLNYVKNDAELFTQVYIDDKTVIQVAPFDTMLWHTGEPTGEKNINNSNSIGIEMCVDTKLDENGNPSEELTREARERTYSNAIRFIQDYILPKYPDIEIVMHHHVWGKDCPHYILQENRWEEFLNRVYSNDTIDADTRLEDIIIVNSEETFEEYFTEKTAEELSEIIENLQESIDNSLEIMGYEPLNINQAEQYIYSINPAPKLSCSLSEWLNIVDEGCRIANVNPNVVVAQSLLETGFFNFTGIVYSEQNNFSGHGATGLPTADGDVERGTWFTTAKGGIYAQIVHLVGYASVEEPKLSRDYDNRFYLLEEKRGFCPTIYSLARNGETDKHFWAYDMDYGFKIEKIINDMLSFAYDDTVLVSASEIINYPETVQVISEDEYISLEAGDGDSFTIIEY